MTQHMNKVPMVYEYDHRNREQENWHNQYRRENHNFNISSPCHQSQSHQNTEVPRHKIQNDIDNEKKSAPNMKNSENTQKPSETIKIMSEMKIQQGNNAQNIEQEKEVYNTLENNANVNANEKPCEKQRMHNQTEANSTPNVTENKDKAENKRNPFLWITSLAWGLMPSAQH